METLYSVNLKRVEKKDAVVPAMDRGFLYGDSIYEVVRTYKGKLFHLETHYERLLKSASRIALKVPFNFEEIKKHISEMVAGIKEDLYIRIIVTRGEDSIFDLNPGDRPKSTVYLVAKKMHVYPKEFFTEGIVLSLVSVMRTSKNSLDPEIKSGNYLNNVLAIMEAKSKGTNDALMVNDSGFVTESTTSNVFIVKDGLVLTPKFEAGILHGITRHLLIKIMEENGIKFSECDLKPEDVKSADECFVTATTKEVMPVKRIDEKEIGSGKVGETTKRLMDLFKASVVKEIGE